MANTTSCSMAFSVNCDSTKENQDAFRAVFETAIRGMRALVGAATHDAGNAQFYGGIDFPGGDLYLKEADVPNPAPVKVTTKTSV